MAGGMQEHFIAITGQKAPVGSIRSLKRLSRMALCRYSIWQPLLKERRSLLP